MSGRGLAAVARRIERRRVSGNRPLPECVKVVPLNVKAISQYAVFAGLSWSFKWRVDLFALLFWKIWADLLVDHNERTGPKSSVKLVTAITRFSLAVFGSIQLLPCI